ncbi:5-bromo-4-chloroindolyl phosphate hydrolysis family protein [Paracoccus stylophorae]|uniref:5-bromo-4-chloroindolyl phosphate hydrolysis family protein n=1 Tax=Paracoccus stylophorae TaxID=659350 RepID=A0ABY7STR4_9RHOB|nr:5-bromo-4-chloroindolyl phosphate hydrolysis family protein [Paracoccus stylophorae]WCR10442.1 5-bromo-4-chloroindolyl phosphate hydrolysis family protein [Paracoccus stylophorae]
MATRFGGRFSPDMPDRDGRRAPSPPRLHRLASRPKWVTIAATPFLLGAFFQGPLDMVTDLAAFGVIAAAMWMTREGLAAEAAYDARRVARRPAIPRKLFGGVLTGLGLGLGAAEPGAALGAGAIGIAGLALHWLAFGADPMRDKGMEGVDDFQQSRAARMIEEGEAHLAQMQDTVAQLRDRQLQARVAMFAATVQDLFDRVRENPGDLSAARRYMGVYLVGARDATAKFAALYRRTEDPGTRAAYETFLDDLEKDFSARSDRLLEGDRSDLEIEIAVLRDRLAREGVRPRTDSETGPEPATPRAVTSQDARTLDDLLTPDRDPAKTRR